MVTTTLEIGRLIEEKLTEVGMSKAEFGRRMNTSRQNVNTLLRKEDMGILTLINASNVLKTNFFNAVQRHLPKELRWPMSQDLDLKEVIKVQVEMESPSDLAAFEEWWRERKG